MTDTDNDLFSDVNFTSLGLPEELTQGIAEAGFDRLTRIQAQSLPLALEGHDVAAQSQTGTGKTAAFLIAIYARLLADPDRPKGVPGALVIAPTRELAIQIRHDAELIGKHTSVVSAAIYGGMDYDRQERMLRDGIDLVIGTPGRLKDYLRRGVLKLEQIRILVIDEADRMFDMGFIRDIRFMLARVPPPKQRQAMLFSATLGQRVQELAYEHMNEPTKVEIQPDQVTARHAKQTLYHTSQEEKFPLFLGLLAHEQPTRSIIFANTKHEVARLAHRLEHNGYEDVATLTSDLTQQKRTQIVKRFKEGQLPIVVATDVASRGIHVEGVSHVFNYDLPQDPEDYVHRIGRTARVGEAGHAVSLACDRFVYSLEAIEKLIGECIDVKWPTDELMLEDKSPPFRRTDRPGGGRGGDRRPGGGGGGRGGPRGRPGGGSRPGGRSGGRADEGRPRRSSSSRPSGSEGAAKSSGPSQTPATGKTDAAAEAKPKRPARRRKTSQRPKAPKAEGGESS